jgi:hypothetical protein
MTVDPELYLRLHGEDQLLRPPNTLRSLGQVATALVAVGALELEVARKVVEDYAWIDNVRRGTHHWPASAKKRTPRAVRIVRCNAQIELASGLLDVRSLFLAEGSTRLSIGFREMGPNRQKGVGSWRFAGATFVDADGASSAGAGFKGSADDGGWRGHLRLDAVFRQDTPWIEIDGHRVDLEDGDSLEVSLENVDADDPAIRFLFHELAIPSFHMERMPTAVVDALVATGALSPNEPRLEQVRAVAEALRAGAMGGGQPGGANLRDLPEPWKSVLTARSGSASGPARRMFLHGNDPVGTVRVDVTTPPIDGRVVEIGELASFKRCFTVDAVLTGKEPTFDLHGNHDALEWWAWDDLGNHWLGEWGGRGGGSIELYVAGIDFQPALDPNAKLLMLAPTGLTQRCVIPIALDWAT